MTDVSPESVKPGTLFRSKAGRSARGTPARMLRIIDTDGVYAVAENTATRRRSRMSIAAIIKRFDKFGDAI